MTSLPSQSISITCFDSDYKYRNFFDNGTKYIYVRFEYIGNEQTFSSKNFVVIKKDDSENGSKTSLNTTKMTGTDFLTYMSDEYSETPIALYPSPSGFVNIRDKIVDALTWAKDHYKNVFDLNFSVGVEVALLDTTRPVASTQFNVALQKLCNADGAAVTLNNEFVKVDYDYLGDSNILAKQKNYINISFSEQFNKPIEKIYPKIKELSLTKYQFRQNDEKVLLCDKASIYLIYRVSDVVYFDSIVWIPDFDDTLYTGYVELYTDDGTKYTPESIGRDSSVFNYTVGSDYISVNNGTGGTLGGDIKLTVYGNKINFDRLISKYQLNSEGENLTIDNEYIDALMSEYDINEYVNEIAKGYDLTTEHQLSARGNFDILAGDIILYQADNTGTRYGLVTNHILKYNGALQSELTVLDVSSYSSLTPANDLFPNDNLFIRN